MYESRSPTTPAGAAAQSFKCRDSLCSQKCEHETKVDACESHVRYARYYLLRPHVTIVSSVRNGEPIKCTGTQISPLALASKSNSRRNREWGEERRS